MNLYIHSAVQQYGGFKRALAKKSGGMIRDRVRILYLLFLWFKLIFFLNKTREKNAVFQNVLKRQILTDFIQKELATFAKL